MFELKRFVRVNKLFSFYGPLLTDRQQDSIKLYYYHDLSLSEIAHKQDISRQGVYDNLKRSEKALENYEEKLGLLKNHKKIADELKSLEEVIKSLEKDIAADKREQLFNILKSLKKYQEGESV